jgi:hypothetical protein
MIRAGFLALVLAGPAGAEGLAGQALCEAAWARVSEGMSALGNVSAPSVAQEGDWCVVETPVLDMDGPYVPDWHMDRLRLRGSALGWIADGSSLPEGLEVAVEGLRLVVQTGDARMDWLFAAQSRPNAIHADLSLAWDPVQRALRLEGLTVDFPGENLLEASALVAGVDLSSTGSLQMSATAFAVTEADLRITMNGLFEWYALMALGPVVLPPDGDMDAAFKGLQRDITAALAELPGTTFSDSSKAAMAALVADLPNPLGVLTLSLRAEPGLGPTRVAGFAATGGPDSLAEAAPLFDGVAVDVGWTPVDAP